jgi:catechol 2,3-dioxygenase-like lactoylglutathione lyase family enzyme
MSETSRQSPVEMRIEIVVIPVSDVDRAKRFYSDLGWRLDIDFHRPDGYRVIQFTPPGSDCSVIFGKNVTLAPPGSAQGLYLVVYDIVATREELIGRGIPVSELFHDTGGVFHHADSKGVVQGPNPERCSYATYASFNDPDGNGWLMQEVTARLSGDLKADDPRFTKEIVDFIRSAAQGP